MLAHAAVVKNATQLGVTIARKQPARMEKSGRCDKEEVIRREPEPKCRY
jgi:hypothetical protein